ncbi:glycosyltransferase family 4 protein [Nocardioides szechwanensis]|nr:glycosyltransferase family 4 protein [Nocardioides szechwanensis]
MRQDELREKGRKEARRELSIAENYFWVLFTGGNSRLKGFDTALRAIGRTRLSEIRLLAVGVGGDAMTPNVKLRNWVADPRNAYYRLRVAALLKSRSVQERVVLLGPRNDMSVPYSASDVVIFPSSLAHQARPVYEAGSFGLPIVISDFPSAAEFVFPGSNGLLIPPRDAPKLAAALDMLASQREYCAALGAENRRQHSSRRQFSVMQRLLVELVKDVGEEGP